MTISLLLRPDASTPRYVIILCQATTFQLTFRRKFGACARSAMATEAEKNVQNGTSRSSTAKLHGRAFYESIGSPQHILAPMVDQSEFAWRMLTRSFLDEDKKKPTLLAYSPMFHARLFTETPKYRSSHFEPIRGTLEKPATLNSPKANAPLFLDGNPSFDRPLIVQFCANDATNLLEAAQHVAPYCDAVDLNLGCPQGIAKRGHYGAFLQEDWDTIRSLISTLHVKLDVPVTAKFRILETKEKTLEYARMILDAGASILTVHGRRREQKGHATGLADWTYIRYLRENLPKETVIFANGNILQSGDIARCLDLTGADAVMSAEGNRCDPTIFASVPPADYNGREYWRGSNGKGGWRMDAVMRRYIDILYKYVLEQDPPQRKPLFVLGDDQSSLNSAVEGKPMQNSKEQDEEIDGPPKKKQKREKRERPSSPNLVAMQAHLFHMLRPLVSKHTHVRDALARARAGDIPAFEHVLRLVEEVTRQGIIEEASTSEEDANPEIVSSEAIQDETLSSSAAVARCRRPFFICQSYVRPLPNEALEKGSIQLSKKDKEKKQQEESLSTPITAINNDTKDGIVPSGSVEEVTIEKGANGEDTTVEAPREGLVCG